MKEDNSVEFNNKASSLPGAIAGAAIAIGVPAVALIYGGHLSANLQLTIVILGIAVGGLIALTATFFGLVMPSSVNHGNWKAYVGEDKTTVEKRIESGKE
jgi:hypothetical protein